MLCSIDESLMPLLNIHFLIRMYRILLPSENHMFLNIFFKSLTCSDTISAHQMIHAPLWMIVVFDRFSLLITFSPQHVR